MQRRVQVEIKIGQSDVDCGPRGYASTGNTLVPFALRPSADESRNNAVLACTEIIHIKSTRMGTALQLAWKPTSGYSQLR